MNTVPRLRLTAGRPALAGAWGRVVAAFESRPVAFALLLALQLKVVWGMWALRDVTVGDTMSYFADAYRWYAGGEVNVIWSPLYTAFYGSFLFLNPDPVWATFAHRLVIVVAAAVLVLAVLRQLLPPGVAWACAAWWACLPIVFNTLYEVHLFAVIPVLASWLLFLTAAGPWRRGAGLAVLGASAVLVRNELSVAFGLLGLVLVGYEWRRAGRGDGPGRWRTAVAYATALAAAAAVVYATYAASYLKYPELRGALKEKHTLNMAQVYAFGHQQRHPEWTLSPWVECHGLMQEHFGSREPSLREMVAANPAAVWEHFTWNLSLTPNGLQLLLFNRAAGSVSPDYDHRVLPRLNSRRAVAGSVLVLGVWAAGACCARRARREGGERTPAWRAVGWAAMFAVAAVVPLVILTQRPRPSYLLAFGVVLMALTGAAAAAVGARWRLLGRVRLALPLLMVGAVVAAPRYYAAAAVTEPQTHADAVRRLWAHRDEVNRPGQTVVATSSVTVAYAHPLLAAGGGKYLDTPTLITTGRQPGESFVGVLARAGADYVLLDEWAVLTLSAPGLDPEGDFRAGRDVPGWRLVTGGDAPGDRWRLYRKVK
ncbi:MAG: hypothetical protein C0501_17900 [Isosphaera sp.]|nr:hypothetical protein [Isosphaera sp.]